MLVFVVRFLVLLCCCYRSQLSRLHLLQALDTVAYLHTLVKDGPTTCGIVGSGGAAFACGVRAWVLACVSCRLLLVHDVQQHPHLAKSWSCGVPGYMHGIRHSAQINAKHPGLSSMPQACPTHSELHTATAIATATTALLHASSQSEFHFNTRSCLHSGVLSTVTLHVVPGIAGGRIGRASSIVARGAPLFLAVRSELSPNGWQSTYCCCTLLGGLARHSRDASISLCFGAGACSSTQRSHGIAVLQGGPQCALLNFCPYVRVISLCNAVCGCHPQDLLGVGSLYCAFRVGIHQEEVPGGVKVESLVQPVTGVCSFAVQPLSTRAHERGERSNDR